MTRSSNIYETLKAFARSGKMPHALIIEDGDTEKALEEILFSVKIMLCDSESDKPCGECGNCVKVAGGSHTDIKILEPEKGVSSIRVEDIREVREDAYILSIEGKQKFYIIKDADLMTVQAQNAFIKLLEEPPDNVNFILICRTATSLLATVRSRCQIYSNISVDSAANEEMSDLAKKIADMCSAGDVCGLMSATENASNDRNELKILLENLIEEIIKRFSNGDFNKAKDIVEELWDLLKISGININVKLFKGRIMAALMELGGRT